MSDASSNLRRRIQWAGLIAGPFAAVVCYVLLPDSYVNSKGVETAFTDAGRATLAAMAWMAVWWLTEAVEVSVTALLPLALFPIIGVASINDAAAPYADELIFLFMGGFLLALSMQRWGLDRRIAILTLRFVGTKPANMVGGFMVATAVLSAFVSNTATTAMMLPIAVSVITLLMRGDDADEPSPQTGTLPPAAGRNFALCLMLGIAYAASIGGIATIIGTPPNGIVVGFIDGEIADKYQRSISFVEWMKLAAPLSIVFLPIAWFLLTRVLYPIRLKKIEGGAEIIRDQWRALGPPNRGQWVTFIVFMCTALAWMFRPLLTRIPALEGLSDAGIAMCGAMLLFVIPVDAQKRVFTMNWSTARTLPWGILILFGGGLSLAAAVKANGVAEFIGSTVPSLSGLGSDTLRNILLVMIICTIIIFLTELTSNTATTAALVPILAAIAPTFGIHPYLLIIPAALAASCAFMMPVATPPNAIVFASGYVTIPQMCRAGLWLNLIGVVIVTLLSFLLIAPALGV